MASTASDLLKLELQADGENDSTWGALAVVLFERLEEAVAELISITVTAANYTLDDTQYVKNSGTTAESHVAMIKTTGALTANRSVIVPTRKKQYLIWNTNSAAFTLTVKTSAGTGVVVPQGYLQQVFCDGTNVEAAGPAFSSDGDLNMNGRSILDTSGNELITFTETASAVNQVSIVNSATGNAVEVQATGDDTNIDLKATPKGAGGFNPSTWSYRIKGGDIASAGPLVIDTDGDYFDVTGTTGFAAMTVAANRNFETQFDGILTITHHATNCDLPGEQNIVTAAGDVAEWQSTGANTVQCVKYTRATGKPVISGNIGKQTIGVGAGGMTPATTSGCKGATQTETTTYKVNYKYLAFDKDAIEYAHFDFPSPKGYNASTMTFIVDWTHPAATTFDVIWTLELLALDNDDALDTAYGTGVDVTDTGGTTGDLYQSVESGAVTPSGTPAKLDRIMGRISRKATDGADTLDVDAHLIGISVLMTIDAGTDD